MNILVHDMYFFKVIFKDFILGKSGKCGEKILTFYGTFFLSISSTVLSIEETYFSSLADDTYDK